MTAASEAGNAKLTNPKISRSPPAKNTINANNSIMIPDMMYSLESTSGSAKLVAMRNGMPHPASSFPQNAVIHSIIIMMSNVMYAGVHQVVLTRYGSFFVTL